MTTKVEKSLNRLIGVLPLKKNQEGCSADQTAAPTGAAFLCGKGAHLDNPGDGPACARHR
jgi:hypothetical protein